MLQKLRSKYGNGLIVVSDQAIVSGVNFTVSVLLARYLGISEFGKFGLISLIVLFNASLHQALITTPALTLLPKKSGMVRVSLQSALSSLNMLAIIAAIILTTIFVTLSDLVLPGWDLSELTVETVLLTGSFLMHDFLRKSFFADKKTGKALILDTMAYGVQISLITITIITGSLSLKLSIRILIFSFLLASIYGSTTGKYIRLSIKALFINFREIWIFNRWLIATSILQWFSGNLFVLAAGSILGPIALGSVRIGQNVIGVLNVIFLALENRVPVSASLIYTRNGFNSLIKYLLRIEYKGLLITILFVGGIFLFAGDILDILYGVEFSQYAYILQGFGILYIFVFTGIPVRFALRTMQLTREIFISYLLTAIISICVAFPVVRSFEIYGVVIGMMAMQIIMTSWYLIVIFRKSKSQLSLTK